MCHSLEHEIVEKDMVVADDVDWNMWEAAREAFVACERCRPKHVVNVPALKIARMVQICCNCEK